MLLVRSYRTFAPLPVRGEWAVGSRQFPYSLLSIPYSPSPSAVCFCGTILTVTRTGRYPASLIFREPGLSSDSRFRRIRNHLRLLFPSSSLVASSRSLLDIGSLLRDALSKTRGLYNFSDRIPEEPVINPYIS